MLLNILKGPMSASILKSLNNLPRFDWAFFVTLTLSTSEVIQICACNFCTHSNNTY